MHLESCLQIAACVILTNTRNGQIYLLQSFSSGTFWVGLRGLRLTVTLTFYLYVSSHIFQNIVQYPLPFTRSLIYCLKFFMWIFGEVLVLILGQRGIERVLYKKHETHLWLRFDFFHLRKSGWNNGAYHSPCVCCYVDTFAW